MRNLALFLKYDGTAYHGWQVQKNACSVAQTLEEAAADVVGHPVHMTGCGRTDAGVHARTYVANFRTESRIPVDRVAYALNTHLPADIVVTGAREVPLGFNAIGSCVRKEYTYQIYNSRIRDPFFVNRAWFYPKHLDEAVMQEAAAQFVGTHDFAAVRSVGTDVKSTVRTVYYFDVERRGELIPPARVRKRISLQYGARHDWNGRLRCGGKNPPAGHRPHSGERQPYRCRSDRAARRPVHDAPLV